MANLQAPTMTRRSDDETGAVAIWLWLALCLVKWVPPALVAAFLVLRALLALGVGR